ncbi:tyrosine-type recombinase/integrase [Brevibacterium album]|uniref:tyrosine-type recombinase/integrase n=1 Tax=Brevibacterium album TaxID=417948 RepID=UPI00146F9469|nr:site-specific integrase [Brevibacterium album]
MPRSIRSRVGLILSLYRWMHLHQLIDHDPTRNVRLPRVPQRSMRPYLCREDAREWVDSAMGDPERPISLLVLLWLLSGLRPSEPLQITGRDVLPRGDQLTVTLRRRKNGGSQSILLPEETAEVLLKHVSGVRPIIRNARGEIPSMGLATHWLRRWCRRNYVAYVPPYSLRVTYITLGLESGADPRHIAGSADHTLAMTSYYDRLHGSVSHNPGPGLAAWIREPSKQSEYPETHDESSRVPSPSGAVERPELVAV